MSEKFYITTTLPYVNADPHIGFALEIVHADAIARYRAKCGDEVFFNTGTDEHGVKIYRKAEEENMEVQAYVDEYAARFDRLKTALNLSYNNFIRTTDAHHVAAAQEFWRRCLAADDIYKKNYQVKYCIGCELEKTDSELVDGKCPIHPTRDIEVINEENYFFRFSKYQEKLLSLYKECPDFVLPASRLKEIRTFVEGGLEDFSISRLKEKMPWGIAVPDDPAHVMYVWFDALVNYISAIGWPEDEQKFNTWWPGTQVAGKDNLRQQSAMWQAMLLSAGLPASKQILIHGFINSGGRKMSKSTGNVVDPFSLAEKYGTDALRFYLISQISFFEDSDFTEEKFLEGYNSHLANSLGNLISRVLKMANQYFEGKISEKNGVEVPFKDGMSVKKYLEEEILPTYDRHMEQYELGKAAETVWVLLKRLDGYITDYEPYKLVKTDKERTEAVLANLLFGINAAADMLSPFMPETSEKIHELLGSPKIDTTSFTVKTVDTPLFPRK
ncbi:MAG: methionine--tRNA ligase [Candidatus Pacebacteria bacterium]|jgi:methionyl-tRNA synthetase|nr:methionine--tRNA ligase [Candidatus Paceibacterota bacterium]